MEHDVTENIVIFHVFTESFACLLFFCLLFMCFFFYDLIYGTKLTGASAHSKVKRASVSVQIQIQIQIQFQSETCRHN